MKKLILNLIFCGLAASPDFAGASVPLTVVLEGRLAEHLYKKLEVPEERDHANVSFKIGENILCALHRETKDVYFCSMELDIKGRAASSRSE